MLAIGDQNHLLVRGAPDQGDSVGVNNHVRWFVAHTLSDTFSPVRAEINQQGNLILTPIPSGTLLSIDVLGVLVGHSLYWMLYGTSSNILQFDLERESLALIPVPVSMFDFEGITLMRAEDGELSLLSLSGFIAQLWKRNISCNAVPSWGIVRILEMDKLLSLDSEEYVTTHGFAEDNNLVILRVNISSIFTVQIESLQFRKVSDNTKWYYYPFESVYAAGI